MTLRTPPATSLTVLVILLAVLLAGSTQGATSAPPSQLASRAFDEPSVTRAASTPKVALTLKKNPVTTAQRARAKVVVSPRTSQSAVQAQTLRSGRVKVGVRGRGAYRKVYARLDDRRALVVLPKLAEGAYRVRATFLGNKGLERSRSRAMTLRVVAPPVDDVAPSATGFPNETNTGVPTGTNLTPYAGSSTITTANTVIDGKSLGCIRVNAPGVVIRNSHVSCGSGGVVVGSYDGDYSGTPLLLEDVEIDCQDGPGTAVGDALVTVRRANIHGCENGFDVNQSVTVEDSYIHDLWNGSGSHLDGIQLAGGHWNGSDFVCCALNITIRHNTIYGVGADGSLGTSAIISNPRGDANILIENNLLAGGAVALYCAYEGTATNYRVINNRFSRRFSPKVGAYGPSEGCADETLSGNVYHESGAPVHLS